MAYIVLAYMVTECLSVAPEQATMADAQREGAAPHIAITIYSRGLVKLWP